jgi:APA family basic amino acid/polyamine antiporter
MARNNQLPKSIAKVSARFRTPYITILATGGVLTALAYVLDLREAAALTSLLILCVHLAVNLSAIRARKKMSNSGKFRAPFHPVIPSLGLVSCIILMFSLPQESWVVTGVVVVVSAVMYFLGKKFAK